MTMEINPEMNKNSNELTKKPDQIYLDRLQVEAKEKSNAEDPTIGEKVIREGLQQWPEYIDQELQRFKEQLNK